MRLRKLNWKLILLIVVLLILTIFIIVNLKLLTRNFGNLDEARFSCAELNLGDECSFSFGERIVSGECKKSLRGDLVCRTTKSRLGRS